MGLRPEEIVYSRRDGLARKVAPFLPEDSVVRQVFGAQCFSPWLIGPLLLLALPVMQWRVVAVADDGIYVLRATYWFVWRPKSVVRKVERDTRMGPVRGAWSRIKIGPERLWVNWRFYDDVREADASVVAGSSRAAQ